MSHNRNISSTFALNFLAFTSLVLPAAIAYRLGISHMMESRGHKEAATYLPMCHPQTATAIVFYFTM